MGPLCPWGAPGAALHRGVQLQRAQLLRGVAQRGAELSELNGAENFGGEFAGANGGD